MRILSIGRGGWAGLFVVGFLLTCASAASAFWSVQVDLAPTNYAIAESGTLSSPNAATATARGSDVIDVRWTPPVQQLPGAEYRVTRTGGPGASLVVCTVFDSTTPCSDTGLADGMRYDYSVMAVLGDHWQSAAVSTSATTLGVTTTSLASGTVGDTYTTSLVAAGGTGSYTWALSAGELPGWAALNVTTGVITGTPDEVRTISGLVFTVTDSLGQATSASLGLTIARGATTTTVSTSMTDVTYGAESLAEFAVTVLTANGAPVTETSGTVTVWVGTATCTVELPAPGCTIGNTALPSGGPYAVRATFTGDPNLTGSAGDASLALTVDPDAATIGTFAVTGSPAIYGAESGLEFTASVSGANASIPDGSTVVVAQGATEVCRITLTGGSGVCSPVLGTLLPVGTYPVTATFSHPNFVTATSTTSVTVDPDTATIGTFAVTGSPVIYGAETGLEFTASVSGANASIPDGATVVVAQGATEVCRITLTGGSGVCSPVLGTVLPVGTYQVTATFGDPNFVTATRTTSVTISPRLEGIEWASVSTTGTFSCVYTNPRAVACTATGVGNRGSFQASVQLVDSSRTPFSNNTGANITVDRTTTGGGGTTTPVGSLVIAQSASATTGSFRLTLNSGRPPTTTITAKITVNGVDYTVSCAVSR